MSILNEQDSLVLIIDVQEKLLNAAFNRESLKIKADIMASATGILNIPTIVTEQYPKGLGSTIESISSTLPQNYQIFEKTSFSALDTLEISNAITIAEKKQILVFGIETHICVSQTTTKLIESGYDVYVISDACGSRTEKEHLAGLNRMKENGAHIITAEIALFEWLKNAKHPNFKEIQNLIK